MCDRDWLWFLFAFFWFNVCIAGMKCNLSEQHDNIIHAIDQKPCECECLGGK